MKRSVFIIIGVVLVLVLLSVWVYVLFFSTSTSVNEEQFGNLDFEDTTDVDYQEPVAEPEPEPVVDIQTNKRLQQLTTRPVAGFKEVQVGTSTPRQIFYMEVGTGHIYSIDLTTGSEERISATTITGAQTAEFSEDGQYVMIQSGFNSQREFVVGEINMASSTLSNMELAEPITSFTSTKDNRFLYTIQTNASTIGKVFNPAEFTNETIFTLPFREASVDWGNTVADSHYVYPKTTRQLESFLYGVKNGVVTRMPVDGYGMSALGNNDFIFYSKQVDNEYESYHLDLTSGAETNVPLVQIPEKCVMGEGEFPITVCANTKYEFPGLLPDNWYSGEVLSADKLWEVSSDGSTATFLIDPESESGRNLDITQLQFNDDESDVYFTNQSDRTLWIYNRIATTINQN